MQNQHIQDEFLLINLTRVEFGDQRNLLHTLELTLFQIQHIYCHNFTYLERYRNMVVPLTDINARLVSIQTGVSCIQTDINEIYTYLEKQATYTVPLLYFSLQCSGKSKKKIKRGIAQHPQLAYQMILTRIYG